MATEGQGRASQAPALTSLPRVEDLPTARDGYDRDKVREAFEAFRRHTTQLQVQLRVLQAAGQSGIEPTGHAVRMDALHLIRAAAEMADTIERDAQSASATQLRRTEEEVTKRQHELQAREGEVERYRSESERQRAEMLNAAKAEARRHQATELTNSARAEVEQTLEWARSQAGAIISRAQEGAEQLLGAAGLGDDVVGRVGESIRSAAEAAAESSRGGPERESQIRSPEAAEESEPPVSPPVSPGPPPPSPEAQSEPEGESDGNDGG